MSSISCYVRLSRPPLVRLRQRRVPALPACHISATFCARARSRARRIRPSMCVARATARTPRSRCIRDLCSPCLLPCLRTSSRVCCSCGRMRRARSSTRGDRQLHAGAGRRDGARAHRPRRRAAAEAQAALVCTQGDVWRQRMRGMEARLCAKGCPRHLLPPCNAWRAASPTHTHWGRVCTLSGSLACFWWRGG